ncbi:MAG: hypothetical protein HUK25_06000 [Treponema sp.]|nr:hypothetical protein [Treponema sp.]
MGNFYKKSFSYVFSFLIILTTFYSCRRVTPKPVQSEEISEAHVEEISEEECPEVLLPCVVLAPSLGLNLYGRDGKMHRMSSLSRGDILETVTNDGVQESLIISDGERNPENYYHAVFDSVDYWIYSEYIAPNSEPAIVIEKLEVKDSLLEDSNVIASLPFSAVIAKSFEEIGNPEEENGYVKIWFYDKNISKVKSGYAKKNQVSTYGDDVEMAAIVEKLRSTTRATPRNELFTKADKLNPSPAMKKILDAEKTEKISYDYQQVLKSMPGARYVVNVEELNTVDQSKDPFKN